MGDSNILYFTEVTNNKEEEVAYSRETMSITNGLKSWTEMKWEEIISEPKRKGIYGLTLARSSGVWWGGLMDSEGTGYGRISSLVHFLN